MVQDLGELPGLLVRKVKSGADNIALTFTPDGKLYLGDHLGAFCSVDISVRPPSSSMNCCP